MLNFVHILLGMVKKIKNFDIICEEKVNNSNRYDALYELQKIKCHNKKGRMHYEENS